MPRIAFKLQDVNKVKQLVMSKTFKPPRGTGLVPQVKTTDSMDTISVGNELITKYRRGYFRIEHYRLNDEPIGSLADTVTAALDRHYASQRA